MEFRTYVMAFRRYWWIAVLTTILGLLGAGLAFTLTPPTFASTVTFYVGTPTQSGINPQSSNEFAEARVNSYVVLISSERVADAVIQRTGVQLTPAEVMSRITAEAQLNTVVVTATVHDTSQQRASTLAQGLADTLGETVSRLDNPGVGRATVVINVVSGPSDLGAVEPRVKVYGGLGLLGGLALGFLLIILRELLDSTIRGTEAAGAVVQAPVLGAIDFDSRARKMPLISRGQNSVRAESFLQLRTNLTFVDVEHPSKVLVVTSPVPSEGKTSVCVNLALTLAENGQRVLLIEGDLRRPRMAALLGLESEIGLTSVLIGRSKVSEAVQHWTPEIAVLTSGTLPPNPSELLGSDRMSRLLDEVRSQFDQILIDTTPLLPVTDAAVAATQADGVLLVLRYGKTSREQAMTAVKSLHAVNAQVIGVVLNARRRRRREKRAYLHSGHAAPLVQWEGAEQDVVVDDAPAAVRLDRSTAEKTFVRP